MHTRRRWVRGAVALLVVLLAARSVLLPADGDGLGHDESIALLAMTGHQYDLDALEPKTIVPLAPVLATTELDPDRGLADLARGLRGRDFHPPLYFVLGQAWLRIGPIFGTSAHPPADARAVDRWLTRLSGCLFWLAVVALAVAGWRREDAVGLAHLGAAAALPTLPYLAMQAFNCRPYPLVVLLAVVAWVLVVERVAPEAPADGAGDGVDDGARAGRRLDVAIGVVLGLGLLTHYLFVFFAAGVVAALLGLGRRGVGAAARAVGAATVLFGPWLIFAGGRVLKPPAHLRKPTAGPVEAFEHLDKLLRKYFSTGDLEAPYAFWMLPAALALVCLLLAVLPRGESVRATVSRRVALCLAAPLAGPLLFDLLASRSLLSIDRVAVASVPLLVWAGAWLLALLPGRWAPGLVAAAALAAVTLSPGHEFDDNRFLAGGAKARAALARVPDGRLLVATTADARGQLLRRVRYLPREADLVFVPAGTLSRRTPDLARPYTHLHVLGVRHAYGGRPRFKKRHSDDLDEALKEDGWRRVASKNRRRNGWALYSRPGASPSGVGAEGRVVEVPLPPDVDDQPPEP